MVHWTAKPDITGNCEGIAIGREGKSPDSKLSFLEQNNYLAQAVQSFVIQIMPVDSSQQDLKSR